MSQETNQGETKPAKKLAGAALAAQQKRKAKAAAASQENAGPAKDAETYHGSTEPKVEGRAPDPHY